MREILFRGKSVNGTGWFEGSLRIVTIQPADNEAFKQYEIEDTTIGVFPNDFMSGFCETVVPETVGQFTGLTDKNGTKIFEGDIGRYKQTDGAKQNGKPITCIGKVVYNAKTASFAVDGKDQAGCKYFDYFPIKDFEVIGNIHDNPELLGGAEDGKSI